MNIDNEKEENIFFIEDGIVIKDNLKCKFFRGKIAKLLYFKKNVEAKIINQSFNVSVMHQIIYKNYN